MILLLLILLIILAQKSEEEFRIFVMVPYFMGYPVSVAIPISIVITMVLLSIAGALVAIAAEVDIRSKVIELVSGGLLLAALTYVLGKSASFLMNFINLS